MTNHCEVCGSADTVHGKMALTRTYKGDTISVDVTATRCNACGEIVMDKENSAIYSEALKLQRERVNAALDDGVVADLLKRTRAKLGMTQVEAAKAFGGGVNAFSRYERGQAQPPVAMVHLFTLLDKRPELVDELNIEGRKAPAPNRLNALLFDPAHVSGVKLSDLSALHASAVGSVNLVRGKKKRLLGLDAEPRVFSHPVELFWPAMTTVSAAADAIKSSYSGAVKALKNSVKIGPSLLTPLGALPTIKDPSDGTEGEKWTPQFKSAMLVLDLAGTDGMADTDEHSRSGSSVTLIRGKHMPPGAPVYYSPSPEPEQVVKIDTCGLVHTK